jgi:hypothetical protein
MKFDYTCRNQFKSIKLKFPQVKMNSTIFDVGIDAYLLHQRLCAFVNRSDDVLFAVYYRSFLVAIDRVLSHGIQFFCKSILNARKTNQLGDINDRILYFAVTEC